MALHPGKCVVMHFGSRNPQYDYFIGGFIIKTEEIVRDLGVFMENSCHPSAHIDKIAKKAHGLLSQIRRSTILRDRSTVTTLYKSFARPLLETSAPAWNPWKRGDIDKLKKVRLIGDLRKVPYESRLQSLECRRECGELIECYKYLNGFNDVNPDTLFSFVRDRHCRSTRSYSNNNLVAEKTSLDARKFFFTNRVTGAWNNLPLDVREASSVNSFKNKYDEYLKNVV